jgi:threonylcarbamoyladenosine tRNA methylthiotransferase CDKAL1
VRRKTILLIAAHLTSGVRAHIEAYGCALNRGEALEFESILKSSGWDIVDSPADANLNVIATCAVIETTENEMIKRAKALSSLNRPLVITGCMASALRAKIAKAAPDAQFVSPDNTNALCRMAGVEDTKKWTPVPWPGTCCHTVPIASGCVGDCAYCITRIARGRLKSRPKEQILEEIRRMDWSIGAKEIQLTAQDSASFGIDIGSSLPDLLNEIASLRLKMKVRVGMMNPRTALPILDELVSAFDDERIFKFLHLPVQSGSNRILKEMGRGYTVEDFETIVREFRSNFPGITVSTDIIVGYPGETKEDHGCNMEVIERIVPDVVNITRFSSRPGTRAETERNKVPGRIAKDRSRELTELRFRISESKNRSKIGEEKEVLVTEHGTGPSMIARTDDYEQVILQSEIELGKTVEVKIVDCSPIHLIAEPIR